MPTFDFAIKRLNKKLVSFRKNTEHNMSLEDEAINPNTSTTGEDLIIDENTVDEPHSISDIQNPDNKNDTQNPYNKNETNKQALPLTI